ncbi:MAG: hypothetical protein H0T45_14355 [Pyrinomonadaceae bacterium]|nr:hypothetical protein [Pyrinomonadaceae bacterium]
MATEGENLVDPAADEHGVSHAAEEAELKAVIDDVAYFHARRSFAEVVLMVPEAVRPEALLVNEHFRLADVRDF